MISIRDMFSMSEACIDRRVHDACDTRLEMLGLSVNSDLNRLTAIPAFDFHSTAPYAVRSYKRAYRKGGCVFYWALSCNNSVIAINSNLGQDGRLLLCSALM
jgi:hypothetical protein